MPTAHAMPNGKNRFSAMPEDHDAIRLDVDEEEPPALEFNAQASPGALVSWAWSQLSAMDAMLSALTQQGGYDDDGGAVLDAVRAVVMPVINALQLSEQRAHEMRKASSTTQEK
jgi:hypothetical protein